jgi:hypothetical protein
LHLQVDLLQARNDFAILQHLAKVDELLGLATGGAHLGEEIPLGNIGTDTTSVTFCIGLPMRVREGSQSFIPHDDGTLSAIQLPLLSKTLPLQWTDWAFLEKHKKDCQAFKDMIEMCKYHGLEKIMGFRYEWNEEVILQFYSTFFFHKNSSSITLMTNGTKYSIFIGQFASILGLGASAKNPLNLHDGNVLGLSQMASMYETSDFNAPTVTNFKPDMIVLDRVIRKTLAPREGDSSRVPQFERNLLEAIFEKTKFNAFDFIIQEMWNIAISNNRSFAYAPYIMAMIEAVSKHTFVKDVEHIPLHPKKPYISWPPLATSVPSASTTSSSDEPHSSSGRSAFFNLFKGLFSICQSKK